MTRTLRIVATLAAGGALLSACTAANVDERAQVVVYAASSLTDAFAQMESEFEDIHPDIDVTFSFAGSQVLRTQIEAGAPADLFASADSLHMETLVEREAIVSHRAFARNEVVVVLTEDAAQTVRSFDDLASIERIVIGTENVPIGRYTRAFFDGARVTYGDAFIDELESRVVSHESNVRLARAKVELGEADAAFVYRTDATPSDRLRVLELPSELQTLAEYELGVIRGATDEARLFAEFVLSEHGQHILASHGFRGSAD